LPTTEPHRRALRFALKRHSKVNSRYELRPKCPLPVPDQTARGSPAPPLPLPQPQRPTASEEPPPGDCATTGLVASGRGQQARRANAPHQQPARAPAARADRREATTGVAVPPGLQRLSARGSCHLTTGRPVAGPAPDPMGRGLRGEASDRWGAVTTPREPRRARIEDVSVFP
jgi:hypothetical protein